MISLDQRAGDRSPVLWAVQEVATLLSVTVLALLFQRDSAEDLAR